MRASILLLLFSGVLSGSALVAQTEPAASTATAAPAQALTLPQSPIEIAEKNGTAVTLSLKDLTKLALQNNLDIAISDTNEQLYEERIRQAYGPYDPSFTFTPGLQSRKRANTNLATAATDPFNKTDSFAWDMGYRQAISTGATISATLNANRSDTNQAFALFNPQNNVTWQLQFTQPLIRNYRIDQTRNTIKLANLDLKMNDSQFKQKVTDTIARIQGLYWDLVGTIRDYEIRRKSVELAQISLDNNRKKVEIGTLAPIAITEAQAELANREVELIQAEERINTGQNSLKALVSNDRNAQIWRQTIVPTDTPDFVDFKMDLNQAIDTALSNRPELEQLNIQMDQSELSRVFQENQKKWQVDLVANFGTTGTSGPQGYRNGQPQVPESLVGGVLHAYRVMVTEGFTSWFVGAQVTIPLKNRSLEAQLAQTRIQRQRILMNRKVSEQQIQMEIRNAVQALETNKKRVDTARIARELAKEQLDGEEKRFQAGLSENFRVLDRQRGLSQAEGAELQALIAYKKSQTDLQKSMYTLLESSDFQIAKTSAESVPQK